MPTCRTILSCLAVAVGLLLSGAGIAAAEPADTLIRNLGKEAIDTLTIKTIDDRERERRFRAILNRAFDMPVIARSTLGQYWRVATPEQKKEYVKLFEDFVVQAYASRFKEYSGESFKVGQTRPLNSRETLVNSQIIRPDQAPVLVQWRVREGNDSRIVDVIVEGISMLVTHRDEFASVIQQNGGRVEGLLNDLRKKTAAMRVSSTP